MNKCDYQVMITDQPHSHSEAYCLVWCRRSTDHSWRRGDILFHPLQSGQASPPWTYQNTGQQTKRRTTTTLTNLLSDVCVCVRLEHPTATGWWEIAEHGWDEEWKRHKLQHPKIRNSHSPPFPCIWIQRGAAVWTATCGTFLQPRTQREGCVLCFTWTQGEEIIKPLSGYLIRNARMCAHVRGRRKREEKWSYRKTVWSCQAERVTRYKDEDMKLMFYQWQALKCTKLKGRPLYHL